MDKLKTAKVILTINMVLSAIAIAMLIIFNFSCSTNTSKDILETDDTEWTVPEEQVENLLGTKVPGEIRIMIIDTGIARNRRLYGPVQYDDSFHYEDNSGHGTHVTGIVVYGNKLTKKHMDVPGVCHNVKIYSCRYFNSKALGNENMRTLSDCVYRAVFEKIDAINISGGGDDFSELEYNAFKIFTDRGGLVTAAAGNENNKLEERPFYPACYGLEHFRTEYIGGVMLKIPVLALKNFVIVSNTYRDGQRAYTSNYSAISKNEVGNAVLSTLPDDRIGYMSGTSMAAPAYLHKLILKKCESLQGVF